MRMTDERCTFCGLKVAVETRAEPRTADTFAERMDVLKRTPLRAELTKAIVM